MCMNIDDSRKLVHISQIVDETFPKTVEMRARKARDIPMINIMTSAVFASPLCLLSWSSMLLLFAAAPSQSLAISPSWLPSSLQWTRFVWAWAENIQTNFLPQRAPYTSQNLFGRRLLRSRVLSLHSRPANLLSISAMKHLGSMNLEWILAYHQLYLIQLSLGLLLSLLGIYLPVGHQNLHNRHRDQRISAELRFCDHVLAGCYYARHKWFFSSHQYWNLRTARWGNQ